MLSSTPDQVDERTNLLRNGNEAATAKDKSRLRTQLEVILFVCVLYFNLYLCLAPEVSIREEIICNAYYEALNIDDNSIERDCTVDDVQRELSLLSQVYVTISQLPGEHLYIGCVSESPPLIFKLIRGFSCISLWSSGYV